MKFSEYDWPIMYPDAKPFKHQVETTKFALMNKRAFILNDLGCVDSETEFLSPSGWVKIRDWHNHNVAQYCKDTKQISFVLPTEYIKKPCNEFIEFDNAQILSPEHRMFGQINGQDTVISAQEAHDGQKIAVYRTFKAPQMDGIPYTDEEIRVMVAYFADGHIYNSKKVVVRLKKQSKILRLRQLLINAEIDYVESKITKDERIVFTFKPIINAQEYLPIFYSCSEQQLQIICDEVWRWDGCKKTGRHNHWEFSTRRKSSADFIQYAFSACGYPTSILENRKIYRYKAKNPRTLLEGQKTLLYIVRASMFYNKTYSQTKSKIIHIGDGFKYCFSLPNTFWLMRRNGKITVTGNTGKSLSILWACDFLFKNAKIKKVLITSPLSTLESVWGKEIFMHFPKLSYAIAHGTKQKRLEAIKSRVNFVIINHHGLSVMKQEIIKEKFDAFVIDELAVFKNHKTEFFKSAREIADRCNIVWGLTAEPTPEAPTEAYSQAKIVNPSNPLIPQTFFAFKNRVMMQISTFTWLPRPEAEKIVYGVLQPAIRFKRSECVDIPDCQIIDQEIELTPEQKTVYKQMKDELLVEYNDGLITASNAAVKMLKLIQVACGWVKSDDGNVMKLNSEPRLNALLDIFNNTEKGKLIVFTSFRAAVVGIKEFFESKNISSECIYSQISQGARAKNINDFQNGKLQTLIIQPQSAAHGITLTSANTAVWHTIIPSRTYYGQANGRITRIGQKSKQLIVRFHGCKEEKRILKLLEGKESMSESLLKMFED